MTDIQRRTRLGDTGPAVFPIALGCMGMSGARYPTAGMKLLDSER